MIAPSPPLLLSPSPSDDGCADTNGFHSFPNQIHTQGVHFCNLNAQAKQTADETCIYCGGLGCGMCRNKAKQTAEECPYPQHVDVGVGENKTDKWTFVAPQMNGHAKQVAQASKTDIEADQRQHAMFIQDNQKLPTIHEVAKKPEVRMCGSGITVQEVFYTEPSITYSEEQLNDYVTLPFRKSSDDNVEHQTAELGSKNNVHM